MSTEPQPAFTYKQVGIALLLIALAVVGYRAKTYYDDLAVQTWVKETPVIQMVLAKRPRFYPVAIQHFTEPYKLSGAEGLREAQMEMQQIFNLNFLTDYIWQVKDKPLKAYLRAQYALVVALLKRPEAVKTGVCERFFTDGSVYADIDRLVGRDAFLAYLTASETLFLSARDRTVGSITPQDPQYKVKVGYALLEVTEKYKSLYPKEKTISFYKGFDPSLSCSRFATYLYALLLLSDEKKQSLLWRSTLDYGRAKTESARFQRGFE